MTSPEPHEWNVVALAGGVGGARLVDGLDRALSPGSLAIVVNTGDDFRLWGLHISPDVDTIMYTLANMSPEGQGWGIDGDTFHVLAEATRRGAPDWFQLGDRDLITHLSRTAALKRGDSLTDVTTRLRRQLGVERPILPMSDTPRPTIIVTQDDEELAFQHWLIEQRGRPAVGRVRYDGSDQAAQGVLRALEAADLVVICPSNPFVSIDPILTLDGVLDRVRRTKTIAVSPIVAGKAVKGPLAEMISSVEGRAPSAEAVALHYEGILDGYVVHHGDRFEADFPLLETNIQIQAKKDRLILAHELIDFARSLP